MADYYCQSGGHTVSALPPDGRCPTHRSPLVRADGSPPPATPITHGRDGGLRPVVRLRIAFGDTVVTVEPGKQVMLGRDPEYSPYGQQFQTHKNVSRRHAELGLRSDGHAWIRDCYSTNLTKVDGQPLSPGQGRDVRDGNTVRLCQGVTGTVELIREEPDGG